MLADQPLAEAQGQPGWGRSGLAQWRVILGQLSCGREGKEAGVASVRLSCQPLMGCGLTPEGGTLGDVTVLS